MGLSDTLSQKQKRHFTTTNTRDQVPYMIAGTAITIVGHGLLTTTGADTSTVKWASYMVNQWHGYWNGYAIALHSIAGSL